MVICFFSFFQTLGNHEFDNDVEGVVPFLKMVKAPVVVTNIDATEEPTMQVRSILIPFSLKSFFFYESGTGPSIGEIIKNFEMKITANRPFFD